MTGLFGGTFDPFHLGHRALIRHAMTGLGLDRILVMPVGRPPHKSRRTTLAAYRFEMARLGTEDLEGVLVSDDEIRRPGLDYTYRTVLRLKEELALDQLVLLAGSDVLPQLGSWHRPEDLLTEVTLAVAVRGGEDRDEVAEHAARAKARYQTEILLFDMPAMDLSASRIRETLEADGDISGMCPDRVIDFIRQYRPYQADGGFDAMEESDWQTLLDLEERAWPYLTQARRLHAASVAQYAARLAPLYGQDIGRAARAGLLHDLAKELPLDRQEELAARYFEQGGFGDPLALQSEDLIHGPASAVLATDLTDSKDPGLERAIAWHSTAHPVMETLGEILFLADKIAYDRPFGRLEEIRRLAASGRLAAAMKRCLEEVFEALARQGKKPADYSLQAYENYAGEE